MKTKTITVSLAIPDDYKYLARQPFGDIVLFKSKPILFSDDSGVQYWDTQDEELSVIPESILDLQPSSGWRESVQEI